MARFHDKRTVACAVALLSAQLLLTWSCRERKADLGMNDSAIELIDSVHDFGLCRGDSIVERCTFRLRNAGTEPLLINKIETSCGCTVAEYEKSPIEPGATSSISVQYNGSGRTGGRFMKTLTIYSNARSGLARLVIRGSTEAKP